MSSGGFRCLLRVSQGAPDSQKMSCFSLWILQYQLCFTSHGFLLPQKQVFLCSSFCCQLHVQVCEGDLAIKTPSKLVYTTIFIIPKKNDCQLLKADFNTHPFPRKKKKEKAFSACLLGWLFFSLSKGGRSKIICYILPSMVKGSTRCSCTLLVLSETISIPTFYLTSHLSSASHAVVEQWRPSCDLQWRLLCCLLLFLTTALCSQLQSCARVCVAQCGHCFEPPTSHPWGLVQTGQIIL